MYKGSLLLMYYAHIKHTCFLLLRFLKRGLKSNLVPTVYTYIVGLIMCTQFNHANH